MTRGLGRLRRQLRAGTKSTACSPGLTGVVAPIGVACPEGRLGNAVRRHCAIDPLSDPLPEGFLPHHSQGLAPYEEEPR
jgi:hypothetical protein